jgi:hypothetical protein
VGDFYWTLNRARIHAQRTRAPGIVRIDLEPCMPNLAALEVSLNGGPWEERPASFAWQLQPGENRLAARGVSAFGVRGPASWIAVGWP